MSEERGGVPRSWTSRARTLGGRVLGSAGQALGADHLSVEATVAFVDGELSAVASQRAATHVATCPECAADVRAQVQARSAVRDAQPPCTPSALLGALQAIPGTVDDPNGPRGARFGAVVLDDYGAWVAVIRPDAYENQRRTRPGEGPGGRGAQPGLPLALLVAVAVGAGAVALAGVQGHRVPSEDAYVHSAHDIGALPLSPGGGLDAVSDADVHR